jgi:hypothetical protein
MQRGTLKWSGLAAVLALLVAGCKQEPPKPVSIENTEEVSATVTAINADTRMMTLRVPSGEEVTVYVDPVVRNLPQVQVGDKVTARYYAAVGVQLKSRGGESTASPAEPEVTVDVGRSKLGERPGGVVSTQSVQTVRIDSIDKKNNTVRFHGSDGLVRSFEVQTSEGREFLQKLKPGDEVEVTYSEALAIGVEPAAK